MSVTDLGTIKSYLEALSQGENATLTISGISYSEIEKDYRTFDPEDITQSPLYGVLNLIANSNDLQYLISIGNFPAFDITKLSELFTKVKLGEPFDINNYVEFIPVYFGNRNLYNGTVYIFQHGLGRNRTDAALLRIFSFRLLQLTFLSMEIIQNLQRTALLSVVKENVSSRQTLPRIGSTSINLSLI